MATGILLPLLVALVPVALFLALARRRTPDKGADAAKSATTRAAAPGFVATTPAATRSGATNPALPPADFGLGRESRAGASAPSGEAAANTGAAAAAAGGALILGYGASRHGADPATGADADGSER